MKEKWLWKYMELWETGKHRGILIELYDRFCRENDLPLRDAEDNLYHLIY